MVVCPDILFFNQPNNGPNGFFHTNTFIVTSCYLFNWRDAGRNTTGNFRVFDPLTLSFLGHRASVNHVVSWVRRFSVHFIDGCGKSARPS